MALTRANSKLVRFETPTRFNNSALPATTAFVKNAGLQYSNTFWVNNGQVLTTDHVGAMNHATSDNNITVTLPPANSVPNGSILCIQAFCPTLTVLKNPIDTVIVPGGSSVSCKTHGYFIFTNYGSASWTVAGTGTLSHLPEFQAKAPLASPAFSGTPTAPTPAYTDWSDKLATTGFVRDWANRLDVAHMAAINLKANINSPYFTGAPGTATPYYTDWSDRLATTAFVRDWANRLDVAHMAAINLKANNHSPYLTGAPAAPTPAASDWSDRLATTAFVRGLISGINTDPTPYFWNRSFGTNGYQVFPGGLILQWGQYNAMISKDGTVIYFPIAFPTACLSVTIGTKLVTVTDPGGIYLRYPSNTSFIAELFGTWYSTPGKNDGMYWMAVGY